MDEKEKEEKPDEGFVLYSIRAENEAELKQFVGHLDWWKQVAKTNNKTLILEARLV